MPLLLPIEPCPQAICDNCGSRKDSLGSIVCYCSDHGLFALLLCVFMYVVTEVYSVGVNVGAQASSLIPLYGVPILLIYRAWVQGYYRLCCPC